jgi:hypothetical protein
MFGFFKILSGLDFYLPLFFFYQNFLMEVSNEVLYKAGGCRLWKLKEFFEGFADMKKKLLLFELSLEDIQRSGEMVERHDYSFKEVGI